MKDEYLREFGALHDKINSLSGDVRELTGVWRATFPHLVTDDKLNEKLSVQSDRCKAELELRKKDSRWSVLAKVVISLGALIGVVHAIIQVSM